MPASSHQWTGSNEEFLQIRQFDRLQSAISQFWTITDAKHLQAVQIRDGFGAFQESRVGDLQVNVQNWKFNDI
jgi:hypothetical protein